MKRVNIKKGEIKNKEEEDERKENKKDLKMKYGSLKRLIM